jgi:hypothetical protein
MLEVPKTRLEKVMPVAVAAALAIGIAGLAFAMWRPTFGSQTRAPIGDEMPVKTSLSAVQPALRPDTAEQGTWIEWSAERGPSQFRVGGYDFRFEGVTVDGLNAARMTVASDEGRSTQLTGQGLSSTARAHFAVVQLDAGRPELQILFATYSGGAHCCTDLTLLELVDGKWRATGLGVWDGEEPALPADLDGDGVKEFTFYDQRFLYAFDSYAGSWPPKIIWSVADGRAREVSSQRRFRPQFVRDLDDMREACEDRSNGACAGYVATAARAGRLDEAWAVMLASYDQNTSWAYPSACRVRTQGECPDGAGLEFATFPEALQWFLGEYGYTAASYVEPLGATGPSYSCGAARQQAERVICMEPGLAMLDRRMARAYTRAMALTSDRSALRDSQRAFLADRNALATARDLQVLYIARIAELDAVTI